MSSSFPAMPSAAQAARLVQVRTRTGVKPYLTPWLLVLPATLMFVALFLLPMLALFVSSFHGYDPNVGIIRVLSVQNYGAASLPVVTCRVKVPTMGDFPFAHLA